MFKILLVLAAVVIVALIIEAAFEAGRRRSDEVDGQKENEKIS